MDCGRRGKTDPAEEPEVALVDTALWRCQQSKLVEATQILQGLKI